MGISPANPFSPEAPFPNQSSIHVKVRMKYVLLKSFTSQLNSVTDVAHSSAVKDCVLNWVEILLDCDKSLKQNKTGVFEYFRMLLMLLFIFTAVKSQSTSFCFPWNVFWHDQDLQILETQLSIVSSLWNTLFIKDLLQTCLVPYLSPEQSILVIPHWWTLTKSQENVLLIMV